MVPAMQIRLVSILLIREGMVDISKDHSGSNLSFLSLRVSALGYAFHTIGSLRHQSLQLFFILYERGWCEYFVENEEGRPAGPPFSIP